MGRSKATATLAGRSLIAHPLAAIVDAGLEPVVVAKPDSELPALGCRVVREAPEPVHPLAGLADSIAVTHAGGRVHPLLGRYAPWVGRLFAAALADSMPLTAVVLLDPRLVGEAELERFRDPERITFNVNSPADLDRAKRWLQA